MNYSSDSSKSSSKSSQLLVRIQDKVGLIYYKHGLICSRHPYLVIIITLIIVSLSCYPITGIKNLLGNSSQKYVTIVDNSLNNNNNNNINNNININNINNNEDNRQTNADNNNQIPFWVRLSIDLIL